MDLDFIIWCFICGFGGSLVGFFVGWFAMSYYQEYKHKKKSEETRKAILKSEYGPIICINCEFYSLIIIPDLTVPEGEKHNHMCKCPKVQTGEPLIFQYWNPVMGYLHPVEPSVHVGNINEDGNCRHFEWKNKVQNNVKS